MWVPRIMQKWLPVQKGEHYHIEESPFPVFIEQPDMVRRDAERAAPLFCFLAWPVISSDGADRVRSVYFRHLVYIDQRFRLHRRFGILGEPSPCPHRTLCTENGYPEAEAKRKRSLISQASLGGGDSWTRTNDPIDVNDVLYRLSHATTLRFEVPTKVSYQLSQQTMFRSEQKI